ncbi:MAG: OmpH family outer membrane protein [Pseudomonadales bacterium]|nr:OmpH family outer membrane protein [Pseudomonadales bacterium]MDP7357745.1 OmpH family outer membrane protein [Pseudomonadales bacterium]MDP7596190.1 OmpH family outer membrane protein [Pseudomonadales bacterium]HJN50448.1 OmpH family outer membrane protein [Pseudomonadales bacterium]
MHKIQQVLTFFLLTATLCSTPVALAEIKIAVVDSQKAILQSVEAKRLLAQIEEEFKGEQKEIRDIDAERTTLLEKARKDGEVMSPPEQRKLQRQIESITNDLTYKTQKYQKEIVERQRELLAGFNQKMQDAIKAIVLSDDYDVVVAREAVVYASELYDITRKATEQLNALDAKKSQ